MRAMVSFAVAVWMTLLSSPVTGLSRGQTAETPRVPTAAIVRPGEGTRATSVFGYIWNARNQPIANAILQLRNVTSGKIEATTAAADNGEFTFERIAAGTYIIEYITETGKVLAVGHVFTVAEGETVATFIRLSEQTRWYAALFGSAGAAVVAAAASLGVTAVAPPARPVSPEG
jgi:hypothetical protein